MKKQIIFLAVIALFAFTYQANAQCKVLLESIAGKYEGGCKKGKADGQGKAIGKDTYEGQFKKGLPNGEGTYTFANGDVYVGEFKNGKKDGAGTLTIKDKGEVIKGYWKDDEYIGKDKFTYKIYNKSPFIISARFSRKQGPDEITFVFLKGGKVVNMSGFGLVTLEGSFGNIVDNGRSKTVNSVAYPYWGTAAFEGKKIEFKINQPGSWRIEINLK